MHEDTYTRRPITPRLRGNTSFRLCLFDAHPRQPPRRARKKRRRRPRRRHGGRVVVAAIARRRRPRRTVPARRARRPPGPAPCARAPPPARWSGAARTPRRWRRARRNTRRPSPPRARARASPQIDRDETRVVELFRLRGARRVSAARPGGGGRRGVGVVALRGERRPGVARGEGARAAPKPRTPPRCAPPPRTLERRAPWPSRADESLDASVSFADRFSDPRRTRARASVRRRDDRGRGREWTGAGAWTGEMPRRNAFVSTKRVSSPCHVSTCVTSPAPDSKIKPSTAVFASVCLSESASHLERQPDVLRTQKKKKWVPRSIAAPIFARSINYHVMPPSNHLAAPSAHTRARRVRGVSARRRSPRVGDVVGIGRLRHLCRGGGLGVGTREAWLLRVPDFDDEI